MGPAAVASMTGPVSLPLLVLDLERLRFELGRLDAHPADVELIVDAADDNDTTRSIYLAGGPGCRINAEAAVAFWNIAHPDELRHQSYKAVPNAVFSNPQVASVGLTEREAEEQEIERAREELSRAHRELREAQACYRELDPNG